MPPLLLVCVWDWSWYGLGLHARCGFGAGLGLRRDYRGRPAREGNVLHVPGDRVVGDRHELLTDSQEATDTDHHGLDLSGVADEHVLDRSNPHVIHADHRKADHLGSPHRPRPWLGKPGTGCVPSRLGMDRPRVSQRKRENGQGKEHGAPAADRHCRLHENNRLRGTRTIAGQRAVRVPSSGPSARGRFGDLTLRPGQG